MRTLLILFPVFFLLGCMPKMNTVDAQKLSALKQKYEDKYHFELKDDLYLIVRSMQMNQDDKEVVLNIYKEFFFDGKEQLRDSSYIYLNYYSQNTFVYQLYYDMDKNEFFVSKTEYY